MTKARILIVEDESIIARDLSVMLKRLGHTILDTAMSGEEAIEKAASLTPDLILMDVHLATKMDGVVAAIRIREEQDVPIIFLTGNTDEATLERAKQAAPVGYLPKPISEQELHVWLEMGLHRAGLERRVQECERYLFSVLHSVGDAVVATDAAWKIRQFNPAAEAITGWAAQEAAGRDLADVLKLVTAAGDPLPDDPIRAATQGITGREWRSGQWLLRRDGSRLPLSYTSGVLKNEGGETVGVVFACRDITERVKAENERERLIGELQAALENVRTLRGLLPICSGCKQIRDDQGCWQSVEQHIAAHTGAQFTHSVCPDCIRKLYPELSEDILRKLGTSA